MADEFYLKDTFSDLLATEGAIVPKRKLKKSDPKKETNENEFTSQCWKDIFIPNHPKDITFVVNSRKYTECRDIINKKLNTASVIVFTGPSGCGKNTVLNVISHNDVINVINCSSLLSNETSLGDMTDNDSLFSKRTEPLDNFERTVTENLLLTQMVDSKEKKSIILSFSNITPQLFLNDSFKFIQILKKSVITLNVPFIISCGDSSQDSIFIKQLVNTLQDKVTVDIINFKPITIKSLCKFAIAMMRTLNIKSSQWVSNEVVEEIALASCGDIRNFILNIQFQYLSQKKSAKRRHSASFKDQLNQLEGIQTKDDKLSLYHCVGKVLYCKRNEDSDDKDLLPTRFGHFYRKQSEVDINDLLNRLTNDYKIFSTTLFENMHNFISNLEDLKNIYDDVCISDTLATYWNENPNVLMSIQHTAIFIFIQTILFWRAHQFSHTKNTFRSFAVPNYHFKNKDIDERYVLAFGNNSSLLRNFFNRKKLVIDGFDENINNCIKHISNEVNDTETRKDIYYSDSEDISDGDSDFS